MRFRHVVAMALLAASLSAGAAHATSLPYVTDLNGWSHNRATITVEYAGSQPSRVRVIDLKTRKRVRPSYTSRRKRLFTVEIRAGRAYRIQLRDGRRWRTVEYRAYR